MEIYHLEWGDGELTNQYQAWEMAEEISQEMLGDRV